MNWNNFLSLRDYFNYYIPGLVWCIVFSEIASLFNVNTFAQIPLTTLNPITYSDILMSILLIFLPYAIGFSLFPLSVHIVSFWQGGKDRRCKPDPKRFILEGKNVQVDVINGLNGKRISQKEGKVIISQAERIFSFSYEKDTHLFFYPILSYIREAGKEVTLLSERALNLKNFTEGLLLPISLFALFSIILFCNRTWYGVLLGIVFAEVLQWLLMERHYKLEQDWVKHVYRAFLVITSTKSQ